MEKYFISPDDLLRDSFLLGQKIIESGFRPDFIVGIWRGGTPVGIAVQELLDYVGIATDHVAIRTSYYKGIADTAEAVQVHGLGYLIRKINRDDSLLIVDDVLDSGRSIEAVITDLRTRCRRNMPADLRVATCWYKPTKNETGRIPDYFVRETDQWLVFPHELQGLSAKEVCDGKPHISDIVMALGLK